MVISVIRVRRAAAEQRMRAIADLVTLRAEKFREVEEAQGTPELEVHFNDWKSLTAAIETLQRMGG